MVHRDVTPKFTQTGEQMWEKQREIQLSS